MYQLMNSSNLFLQVTTIHCGESVLYRCFSDTSDESEEDGFALEFSSRDRDHTDENVLHIASPEASWLELEGILPFNATSPNLKNRKTTAIRNHLQFETELRQHIHDLLHYIDDLERQVCMIIALLNS